MVVTVRFKRCAAIVIVPLLVIVECILRNTLVYVIRFVNFFRRMEERFENKTNAPIFEAFSYLLPSLAVALVPESNFL